LRRSPDFPVRGVKGSLVSVERRTVGPADPSLHDPPPEATGASLTRRDTYAQQLRRRSELPANVGRYVLVLLGSVIAAAAAGLLLARSSPTADGLFALGIVLVLLGVVQHLLLRRDRAHWPEEVYLWADGVELVLHNREIRAISWNDPGLALDVYVRPLKGDPVEETLLVWKSDRHVPPCQLSTEGLERLRSAAHAHGLEVHEYRDAARKRGMRAYEIRPAHPTTASPPSAGGPAPSNL
jgi:hypothetical protein